jgi:RNA polymerase sigma factor (sigma-70 family)
MTNEVETEQVQRHPYGRKGERLKSLNAEAWDLLLRQYAADLRQDIRISVRKRGLSEDIVDDIEQETWLTAVRKISEFNWDNEVKLYNWLRVIALNHIRMYQRQRLNQKTDSVDDNANDDHTDNELEKFQKLWGEYESSIEDAIVLGELYAALDSALHSLKPIEQEILVRWITGEQPRHLAVIYGIKPRTVSMQLLRAKDKIKVYLQKNGIYPNRDLSDD